MLWIDKYCPKYLKDLKCNKVLSEQLARLINNGKNNIPHLLFFGPSGSGKKTRINAVLRAIYGDSVDKIRIDNFSQKDINADLEICQSPHHMQIPCSEITSKDRVIVQTLIKELSSSVPATSLFEQNLSYKVILFQDAEILSESAQAALRRTLEKYVKTTRIFIHTHQLSSIIDPLKSRFLCIRVPSPTLSEIVSVLHDICLAEEIFSFTKITDEFLEGIAKKSQRNLRRAILMLETIICSQKISLADDVVLLPWELYLHKVADKIMMKPSPKELTECRNMIYDLLSSCIPGDILLSNLAKKLTVSMMDKPKVRSQIIQSAAHFSQTLNLGSKEIFHIEAFIAHAMSAMKQGGQ